MKERELVLSAPLATDSPSATDKPDHCSEEVWQVGVAWRQGSSWVESVTSSTSVWRRRNQRMSLNLELRERGLKIFRRFFPTKIKHVKNFCNIRRPIPILVTKVSRRNLDYVKNLQAKYFTGENIPIIYSILHVFTRTTRNTEKLLISVH